MPYFKYICSIMIFLQFAFAGIEKADIQKLRSIPGMLNYQGYLTDTSAIPIQDSLDMIFRIYDSETGITELWSETHNDIPVEQGVFSVILGNSTLIPDSIFINNAEAWLELTLEGPQTLSPRTRITAIGYAYTALFADTAEYAYYAVTDSDWVVNGSDLYVNVPGNVGVGIIYPQAKLDVNGTARMNGFTLPTAAVSGHVLTSDNNGVGTWQLAPAADTDWVIVNNSQYSGVPGNVGIGTTTPVCKLEVIGTFCAGVQDTVMAVHGAVLGGFHNLAGDEAVDSCAVVTGGSGNNATAKYAFIGGGQDNSVSGAYATVCGGYADTVNAIYGCVSSGYNNIAGDVFNDTAAFVGGGEGNKATAVYATVGGGRNNKASNGYSTVAGGCSNSASEAGATVGGGWGNTASYYYATVSGGEHNTASYWDATVSGGEHNTASKMYATVSGGEQNHASNTWTTVAGGYANTAAAYGSFATNYSTEVYASDTNSAAFTTSHTTAPNQVRAASFSMGTLVFTMDHPDDPMNKILNQHAVGSSEPVFIYNGTAYTGDNGRVEVLLPDYFDKINKNARIQLTGVNTSDVYIAEDITGNRFVIGGKPGTKVYWTVIGERSDMHAEIVRIQTPVIQQKTGGLIGHSLDDDALIGIYEGLKMEKPGFFAFKTEEGRRVHEQSKKTVWSKEQGAGSKE
jgi:hypothetical protein